MESNKFNILDIVKHKNGGMYIIVDTPSDDDILEYVNESSYKYICIDADKSDKKWRRIKSLFEDGRFTLIDVMLDDDMYRIAQQRVVKYWKNNINKNDKLKGYIFDLIIKYGKKEESNAIDDNNLQT